MASATHDLRDAAGFAVVCVETFWTMVGRSGQSIVCALYQTPVGLELRAGHGEQDALLRQVVHSLAQADIFATIWKAAAEASGFVDADTNPS